MQFWGSNLVGHYVGTTATEKALYRKAILVAVFIPSLATIPTQVSPIVATYRLLQIGTSLLSGGGKRKTRASRSFRKTQVA